MVRTRNIFGSAMIMAFLPVGFVIAQHMHQMSMHHMAMKSDTIVTGQVVYTCPMDTDVRMTKPGVCPKCGMDLVKMESAATADTVKKARPTKAQFIDDGRYNCCLKDACDQCYREGEDCACYTTVKKTGVVCKECFEGWQHGKGRVPGIVKDSVKAESMESMHRDD